MADAPQQASKSRRCPTVLDLFSGPGGMSCGIMNAGDHHAGFEVVVANDNDAAVRSTYERNHPDTKFVFGSIAEEKTKADILSSIREQTGRFGVDLVVGGPPCKGFSFENKMTRNMDNPMNHLVMHYVDMIERTRPAAFVMENVPGILAMRGGEVVSTLIQKFRSMGYENAEAWLLNAADYGAPQLRKRTFIVGSRSKEPIRPPKKSRTPATYVPLADAIGDLPKILVGNVSPITDSYACKPKNNFQRSMRAKSRKVVNHIVTKNTPLVTARIKEVPPGGNWNNIPVELMKINGKYARLNLVHSMIYKRLLNDRPSVTITNFRKAMIIHPTQHRLLSVREAARIQTFPDHFEFMGGISNMQQQVSDAVPVILARSVGDAVLSHLSDSHLPVPIRRVANKTSRG